MGQNTIISSVVHLLGVSVVSHLISRRLLVDGVQCNLRQASWPRLCVLIVFLDSYLFLFTAGVLILGVGMAASASACSLGIYLCIVFYGTSKIFIYLFLSEFPLPLWMAIVMLSVFTVERVHVVWRPTPTTPRLRSRVYVVCMSLLTFYLGVAGIMFYGRISSHTFPRSELTDCFRQYLRDQRGCMFYRSQVYRLRPSLGLRSVRTSFQHLCSSPHLSQFH